MLINTSLYSIDFQYVVTKNVLLGMSPTRLTHFLNLTHSGSKESSSKTAKRGRKINKKECIVLPNQEVETHVLNTELLTIKETVSGYPMI